MNKIECAEAIRLIAGKYSELGDHEEAQRRITRADFLVKKHINNPNNIESMYNKITGVELLLRRRNLD
jgi:hypothetical protein